MAVLAILQPDARVEARLSQALADAHAVLLHTDWSELELTLRDVIVDACMVDGEHPDREWAVRRIYALRERLPEAAIVACLESEHAERTFDRGALGVDGLVVGRTRPHSVRTAVDRALSVARARRTRRLLDGRIAPPGPDVVAWALENVGPETSVERLAAGLGRTPASLRNDLQRAGLPSPVRLLLWGRMIQAGAWLGEDGRRVEEVAFGLGYSAPTSLARAMKLHTGLTPAEVLRGDGLAAVVAALVRRTVDARAARTGGESRSRRATSAKVAFFGLALLATSTQPGSGATPEAVATLLRPGAIEPACNVNSPSTRLVGDEGRRGLAPQAR